MGGRPSKPFEVLIGQNDISHKTKAELNSRKAAEEALATGIPIREYREVKGDKEAHAVFARILKLLEKIGKHDALAEPVLNRYAILTSECKELVRQRDLFARRASEAERRYEDEPDEFEGVKLFDFYQLIAKLQLAYISCDKQVQAKRKMLFDVEKEMLILPTKNKTFKGQRRLFIVGSVGFT